MCDGVYYFGQVQPCFISHIYVCIEYFAHLLALNGSLRVPMLPWKRSSTNLHNTRPSNLIAASLVMDGW